LLGTLGVAGLGLLSSAVVDQSAPRANAAQDKKPRPKFDVSPPPDDVNDLSMEVAALRTIYLLKASPDQAPDLPDRNQFNGIFYLAKFPKPTAEPPRDRKEAKVSKNYRKVLTDLRAAFIANHEARIRELSDQLEEITKDEQPELDDAIEVTELARNVTHKLLLYFDANRTVPYLAAYGKEFPDPFMLILTSIGSAAKSTKPSADEWPAIRDFVVKEVSWQVGGLNPKKQQQIGAQVAEFLDMAGKLSDAELKKGPAGGAIEGPDRQNGQRGRLLQHHPQRAGTGPGRTFVQSSAVAARQARKDYLGVIGHWAGKGDGQVWSLR
jgi:hypothetical protein